MILIDFLFIIIILICIFLIWLGYMDYKQNKQYKKIYEAYLHEEYNKVKNLCKKSSCYSCPLADYECFLPCKKVAQRLRALDTSFNPTSDSYSKYKPNNPIMKK